MDTPRGPRRPTILNSLLLQGTRVDAMLRPCRPQHHYITSHHHHHAPRHWTLFLLKSLSLSLFLSLFLSVSLSRSLSLALSLSLSRARALSHSLTGPASHHESLTERRPPAAPVVYSAWSPSYVLCHIIIRTMSHHHMYYVTSSYIIPAAPVVYSAWSPPPPLPSETKLLPPPRLPRR